MQDRELAELAAKASKQYDADFATEVSHSMTPAQAAAALLARDTVTWAPVPATSSGDATGACGGDGAGAGAGSGPPASKPPRAGGATDGFSTQHSVLKRMASDDAWCREVVKLASTVAR